MYDISGKATGYRLNDRGVGIQVPVGVRIFTYVQTSSGVTQPPIERVPGVKRPGREADHSTSASAEVRKIWIYTTTPPNAFMA
jgi:hypothetical protein